MMKMVMPPSFIKLRILISFMITQIGCWDHYLYFEYDNGLFYIWNTENIAMFDVSHGDKFVCSIGFASEENKYKVVLTIDTNDGLLIAWGSHSRHR